MNSNNLLTVRAVDAPSRNRDFLKLREIVYRSDPAAVFPLRSMERVQLDVNRHPFYRHAEMQAFVCYRNEEPAGRIAAIKDSLHNEFYNDKTGFFGFFESVNDEQVAKQLISTAEDWLRQRGCTHVRGPVNPSMKSEFGVLMEGHESVPNIMMGHTPLYYHDLLTATGFDVAQRFFAFKYNQVTDYVDVSEKWAAMDEAVKKIEARFPQLKFRAVDKRNYDSTLRDINELGNQVRAANYGFVPLTEPELAFMISQLKRIIRFDMIHAAYWDEQLVGFIVNVPDINWALKQTWGRFDWIRMPQLLYWIKKTKRTRVIALGVHEDFRKKGIAIALIKRLKDLHEEYEEWEFSWVVEDNLKSIRAISRTMPLIKHRVYQVYEKEMAPQMGTQV